MAVSVVLATAASRMITKPHQTAGAVAWWVGILVLATVAVRLTERALRRFLPVVALLKLSLVFPDHAPSRFRMAIRSGTVRQLQKRYDTETLSETPQNAAESLLMLTGQLSNHDRLTRGHSERVRAYSDLIAEELELSREDRDLLHWAALLHDIGKLDVPADILNKPSRPTEAEWELLKGHPGAAAQRLAPLSGWLGDWRFAATQHHERWEGGGYPQGLVGADISLAGRIVAVADAFETITAARSYKEASSREEGRAEIARCAGTHFDPAVVKAFLNVSLGRLRSVAGPLSWIMNAPILAAVPTAAIPTVSTALATTAAMTTMAMAGVVAPPLDATQQVTLGAPTRIAELAFVDTDPPIEPTAQALTVSPAPTSAPAPSPTPRRSFVEATSQSLLIGGFPTPTPNPSVTPSATTPATAGASPTAKPTSTPASATSPTPTTPPVVPTATPQPTSTPSPTPTPTPLPAGVPSVLYLLNPGSGDTSYSPVLAMGTSKPTDGSLANYDTDRDNDPGLLIKRGESSVEEADSDEVQTWTYEIGPASISGQSKFRIYATPDDDDKGEISATVDMCDVALNNCTLLATVTKSFDAGGQEFKKVNINFNLTAELTEAQPVLRVRLWVPNDSDEDLWIAYDTASYRTRLELGGT